MLAVLAGVEMELLHLKWISSTKPRKGFLLFWHLWFVITLLGLQTEARLY